VPALAEGLHTGIGSEVGIEGTVFFDDVNDVRNRPFRKRALPKRARHEQCQKKKQSNLHCLNLLPIQES